MPDPTFLWTAESGGDVVRVTCQDPDCPWPLVGIFLAAVWGPGAIQGACDEHRWLHHHADDQADATAYAVASIIGHGVMTREQFRAAYVGEWRPDDQAGGH